MDVFDIDNVKAEKANAMIRYRRLRTVTNLFRFVELCLALVFISYVSTRLPFALKLSGEYLRRLSSIMVKPVFVFVVSNVIILALLYKSRHNPAANNAEEDELYDEFVKKTDAHTESRCDNQPPPQEIVYQDKQIISEVVNTTNSNTPAKKCQDDDAADADKEIVMIVSNSDATDMKIFRRTKSEKLRPGGYEKPVGVLLRRSETEMCRKIESPGDEEVPMDEELYGVEELSNEEFKRTIEAFIEKQATFHRRERFAVVPHHQKQN